MKGKRSRRMERRGGEAGGWSKGEGKQEDGDNLSIREVEGKGSKTREGAAEQEDGYSRKRETDGWVSNRMNMG